jgi:nucleoside-diphosphate-sugar epimerase
LDFSNNRDLAEMNDRIRILVTGSDGFIGRHLVPHLAQLGYHVVAAARGKATVDGSNVVGVRLPDLSRPIDWSPLLQQCDVVIHLAGIAHKFAVDDLYDRINHQATAELALAASRCGVKHLVLISSIAAQSGSFSSRALTESDTPKPNNAYGRSKLAAEEAVRSSGVSFTILRPVVIYGAGEKGNFAIIHHISRWPIPLPFGALTAKRSVLSIENFNSAIEEVLTNAQARGQTFIVSDPTPVTVADLIKNYRASLSRSSLLVPFPQKWLEVLLKAVGQGAMWERLGCPLVASPTKFLSIGWKPTQPASAPSRPD